MKNFIAMKNLWLTIWVFVLFTACCKDEKPCMDPSNPECENYDPCFGKERPSAKFIMEESGGVLATKDIWFQDSVFAGYMVRFRSELTDIKYKHTWYVGSEVFKTVLTSGRDFRNVSRPNFITISHVIEYEPDLSCFPDDDGKDSVSQTFRLIASFNDEFQTYGTYRGVLNSTVDSFDVRIISMDFNEQVANFNTHYGKYYINLHNRGDTLTDVFDGLYNVESALFNRNGVFGPSLDGTIEVFNDGTFEMNYKDQGNPVTGDGLWHTYKGRKIN